VAHSSTTTALTGSGAQGCEVGVGGGGTLGLALRHEVREHLADGHGVRPCAPHPALLLAVGVAAALVRDAAAVTHRLSQVSSIFSIWATSARS
jgi:hypothetical protein